MNGRYINVYQLDNAELVGDLIYPNVRVLSPKDNKVYNPINERVMSLQSVDTEDSIEDVAPRGRTAVKDPVFFFMYNTDNYYHFLYDTMPYLLSYFRMKQNYRNLRLLMTYPNAEARKLYPFVVEFLELAGIDMEKDVVFADSGMWCKPMFISESYTHGHDSNAPPRAEVYDFLKDIAKDIKPNTNYGQKLYISRRSWKHNDKSNIGTDYTTRRRLANEDKLVDFLESIGYTEVFTETMSTEEKIGVFKQATHVVGAIGGGMLNTLFCPKTTNIECIVSPTFFDVNVRFTHGLPSGTRMFGSTEHVEKRTYKNHMRASDLQGNVGEICRMKGDEAGMIGLKYLDKQRVAGWNLQASYRRKLVREEDLKLLDKGLNSEWTMNLEQFKQMMNE
jgi:capsular polysaccharide biosynthesis protein